MLNVSDIQHPDFDGPLTKYRVLPFLAMASSTRSKGPASSAVPEEGSSRQDNTASSLPAEHQKIAIRAFIPR